MKILVCNVKEKRLLLATLLSKVICNSKIKLSARRAEVQIFCLSALKREVSALPGLHGLMRDKTRHKGI